MVVGTKHRERHPVVAKALEPEGPPCSIKILPSSFSSSECSYNVSQGKGVLQWSAPASAQDTRLPTRLQMKGSTHYR